MADNPNPVERLVARFGSQNRMASLIGARQSEVWRWIKQGRVPSSRIPALIAAGAMLEPPVTAADFFPPSGGAPS